MKSTRRSLVALAIAGVTAAAVINGGVPGTAGPAPEVTADQAGPTYVYKVRAPLGKAAQDLLSRGFDVLEQREGDYLFVLGDSATGQRLTGEGFAGTVDEVLPSPRWTPPSRKSQQLDAAALEETYYGGYRTVNAQYAHLDAVASQYPNLTQTVDYGDSWKKTQGAGGYDLRAICITKKNAGDCALSTSAPKPRFFVMGQLHARELTTGDQAYRWIDHLTQGYGTDAEVTALLDSTEVWVVPIANPDGVNIVQQGGNSPRYQRKNANTTNGSNCSGTSGSHVGIDLNRNTSSHWGGEGTSSQPCAETYKGPSADSEVETRALQALWRNLYKDRRGTGNTDAAPADTTGVVISMHSYSNLVLFPWGWTTQYKTGNDAPLRTMAREMASLAGGWQYGQPGEVLYNAAGATDDWVYDDLGVASFVWEIGPGSGSCSGFFPTFSCQTSTFWPKVKQMLMYSAKKAVNPYGGGGNPPGPCAKATNDGDVTIPDAGAPVSSTINVSGCTGNASATTQVEVHVKHTYRGDLVLDLVAPDGSTYRLKPSDNDSADNIDTTYTVNASTEVRNGAWKLQAQDVYSSDTGYIDSWSLTL